MQQAGSWQRQPVDDDLFAVALATLIARMRAACGEAGEWPERAGAGLYAAVGFLAEEQQMARALFDGESSSRFGEPFRRVVEAMAQLLDEVAPGKARPGPRASAAAIAGIGLVVGDCVRFDRPDRLPALCPELHLMILLPFLGFDEAKRWAQAFHDGTVT